MAAAGQTNHKCSQPTAISTGSTGWLGSPEMLLAAAWISPSSNCKRTAAQTTFSYQPTKHQQPPGAASGHQIAQPAAQSSGVNQLKLQWPHLQPPTSVQHNFAALGVSESTSTCSRPDQASSGPSTSLQNGSRPPPARNHFKYNHSISTGCTGCWVPLKIRLASTAAVGIFKISKTTPLPTATAGKPNPTSKSQQLGCHQLGNYTPAPASHQTMQTQQRTGVLGPDTSSSISGLSPGATTTWAKQAETKYKWKPQKPNHNSSSKGPPATTTSATTAAAPWGADPVHYPEAAAASQHQSTVVRCCPGGNTNGIKRNHQSVQPTAQATVCRVPGNY
eukprot:gene7679-839_t